MNLFQRDIQYRRFAFILFWWEWAELQTFSFVGGKQFKTDYFQS